MNAKTKKMLAKRDYFSKHKAREDERSKRIRSIEKKIASESKKDMSVEDEEKMLRKKLFGDAPKKKDVAPPERDESKSSGRDLPDLPGGERVRAKGEKREAGRNRAQTRESVSDLEPVHTDVSKSSSQMKTQKDEMSQREGKKSDEKKAGGAKSDEEKEEDREQIGREVSVIPARIERRKGEKVLDSYEIEVDGAKVKVLIKQDSMGTSYNLYLPEISKITSRLLAEIRNDLISATAISMKELSDPAAFNTIKKKFLGEARHLLRKQLPNIKRDVEDYLLGTLMQDMMGLGEIEFLIDDPGLEEIVIPSAKEPIRVYSKKYGWLETNFKVKREDEIVNYSNIIARRVGRQITVLSPLLDAHLVTGDRVNAVLYPVNTKGNTITIRKFARDPLTIIDLINNKTCDVNLASVLWLAMEYEMNILISGGTGSGKTSFLNAILPFISPNHRIISIEDTRELSLPEFLYWTPLVTRTPNPEGKGEVSMLDLLINSLRMRPDRIILGEMRKEREAMVLFEAMHTGHSVYATVHADTAAETISRLVNPPLNVPPNLLKSVHLNVVMFRDRKKGIRRVMQVAEFEAEKLGARSNILYRWVPELDKIVKHSESLRFFEDIGRHTGMSQAELKKELKEKSDVLEFLIKNKLRSLQEFGKVMNLYYRNKEMLMRAVHGNRKDLIFDS